MTIPKQHERAVPFIKDHPPQRPRILLQRLSLGIVHALPSLLSSSSKNDLIDRLATAPGQSGKRAKKEAISAESEQLPGAGPEVLTASTSTQPCPYDPNSYHFFASIQKRRCSFCGMRGPKIVHNEPCHACSTCGPDSHITSAGTHRRHSAIDARHLARLANSSDSVLLGPRPVTSERAAMRIRNPPRVSRLPPGITRLPVTSAANANQHRDPVVRPPSRLSMRPSDGGTHDVRLYNSHHTGIKSPIKKPTSPKLHHLPLLPHSDDHPFVHRHEIPKHAIALRAWSTSPLTDRSNISRTSSRMHKTTDYSDTVYYAGRRSPLPSNPATARKAQITTVIVKQLHRSGGASIGLCASPLDTALAESEVYKKLSPKQESAKPIQALNDITDSSTTFGSQDAGSTKVGNMRLELRGGSSDVSTPRLRGGSGYERASTDTFVFKLKRWILLCQPCHKHHDDSDDDLPPARAVTPERVAKMRQRMNGTAPLPAHIFRETPSVASSSSVPQMCPGTHDTILTTTFTTTTSGPQKRPLSSCLSISSLFHRRSLSPVNQPAPVTPAQVLNPPFPQLRGGAGSPDGIPPTLFWLAGGTGRKPISFSDWKQSRHKQRMGGLLGMSIFGDKYGQEYKVQASVTGDVESQCSANVKVTVGDGVGAEEVESAVVAPTPSSSASSKAEPVKELAAVAEEVVPDAVGEPVQRRLTPPPTEPADDVPLCSGALPAEPDANVADDVVTLSKSSNKADDAVVIEKEKAHAV